MGYTDELLHRVQSIEFGILKDFKDFCQKSRLHYFLIGGTLLGAVRHGGFIPWDDDIDVGMERSEYERFIRIWQEKHWETQGKYYLQCKEIDEKTPMPYAKLRRNGTVFIEKETVDTDQHKGFFIDIFPFDFIPSKVSVLFRLKYIFFKFLTIVSEYKNGYRGFSNNAKRLLCFAFSGLSFKTINRFQYRFMTQFRDSGCNCITSIASGYGYMRHCSEKSNFCGGGSILFCGEQFECPVDNDRYLTHLFGPHYMELPPIEKRVTNHNVLSIQFPEESD
ncbi:MAG: LicD family protein [Spirochaetales bacterium]|nr:LicD family protein [Spirochaetales bacterium]